MAPHRSSLKANTFLEPRYMGQLLRYIATFLGLISPISYAPYLALDINLRGGHQLHLVSSIHMGTVDMAPLPTRLDHSPETGGCVDRRV